MVINKFCEVCRLNNECGYISRNIETLCPEVHTYLKGYDDGYDDALINSINIAYRWIEDNCNIDEKTLDAFSDYMLKECKI